MQITLEELKDMLKIMYLKGKMSIISPELSHNLGMEGEIAELISN